MRDGVVSLVGHFQVLMKLCLALVVVALGSGCSLTLSEQAYQIKGAAPSRYKEASVKSIYECLSSVPTAFAQSAASLCLETALIEQRSGTKSYLSVFFMDGEAVSGYAAYRLSDLSKWKKSLTHQRLGQLGCLQKGAGQSNKCAADSVDVPRASVKMLLPNAPQPSGKGLEVVVVRRDQGGFQFQRDVIRQVDNVALNSVESARGFSGIVSLPRLPLLVQL